MKIPKGIEGDYIETKRDNLFFDVKGCYHPSDRKICFIRFYPHPEGDRIKSGRKYKKIYNLEDRYSFLRSDYPKYLYYSEQFDTELQSVKNEDIKKIYTPREYYKELSYKNNLNHLEKSSRELCMLFIEKANLPGHSIGITGSQMVGLCRDKSDIDLIIYGTDISHDFQDELAKILNSDEYCRQYTPEEYIAHYNWRAGGSDIPLEKFIQYEKRKLHQGMYRGYEFFIRYLKSPNDWKGSYYDFKYKNMGRIEITAQIIDASDALFTPCSYKIEGLEVFQSAYKIKLSNILEINSFRGRFCEQAIKGETVLVRGKLEKVIFRKSKEYYRILLTDQREDKMIIL